MQRLLKRILTTTLVTGMLWGLFVPLVAAEVADHVVISEIQADSIEETGGIDDDWIELYNPTSQSIDLAVGNYRIEKTQTVANPGIVMVIGNTDDGSYPGGTTIPAYGFYLIVRDDASQTLRDKADAISTRTEFTWTGTAYTLYLGTGAIGSDTDPDIIDKVGFGSGATYYETSPAPSIPEGHSLQRNYSASGTTSQSFGPSWDTDNNSADFFIQTSPNPQNSSEHGPIPPFPEFSTITLFSLGLLALCGYLWLRKNRCLKGNRAC